LGVEDDEADDAVVEAEAAAVDKLVPAIGIVDKEVVSALLIDTGIVEHDSLTGARIDKLVCWDLTARAVVLEDRTESEVC
jgi:hypothetical protein